MGGRVLDEKPIERLLKLALLAPEIVQERDQVVARFRIRTQAHNPP